MKHRMSKLLTPPTHLWIPDTQVKPGVPTFHLPWIGQYVVDEFAGQRLTVIHGGDHWDMPSLSSYDKRGGTKMEGRRVAQDLEAGQVGFDLLADPIYQAKRRRPSWDLDLRFLPGNHEWRIERAVENDAQIEGLVSLRSDVQDYVEAWGWRAHEFLEPVTIDGVIYSHYFYNPSTGRPYAGANLETRLKTVGHSFTMGHQQGLKWGRIDTVAGPKIGLVAGSCYLHDEDYLGPQSISYWRGIVVKHQVEDGSYDPMFVSLDYLCRRYEGMRLDDFRRRYC